MGYSAYDYFDDHVKGKNLDDIEVDSQGFIKFINFLIHKKYDNLEDFYVKLCDHNLGSLIFSITQDESGVLKVIDNTELCYARLNVEMKFSELQGEEDHETLQ